MLALLLSVHYPRFLCSVLFCYTFICHSYLLVCFDTSCGRFDRMLCLNIEHDIAIESASSLDRIEGVMELLVKSTPSWQDYNTLEESWYVAKDTKLRIKENMPLVTTHTRARSKESAELVMEPIVSSSNFTIDKFAMNHGSGWFWQFSQLCCMRTLSLEELELCYLILQHLGRLTLSHRYFWSNFDITGILFRHAPLINIHLRKKER
jgi:hypothetical protein